MQFGIGWLVVVWIIWSAIFFVTMALVRFAMRGQQEHASEEEAKIIAAQAAQGHAEPPAAATSAAPGAARPERPTPRPQQPFGPPLSAT